jgi:hypothetical protein
MPRVVHFEIPVDNTERAVKFYDNFIKKAKKAGGKIVMPKRVVRGKFLSNV